MAPTVVLRSIAYGDDPFRQTLDVYLPATDGPHPTVLGIHGGGFWARSKSDYEGIGRHLAERGFAFVAIDYRLVPSATYPAQVADSLCAVAWVYATSAEHGFDTSRVAVTGGSAGGYLAAMVATVDDPSLYGDECPHPAPPQDPVRAAVVHYGLFDFTDLGGLPADGIEQLEAFWGAEQDDLSVEERLQMSPIGQLDDGDPAFLLFHGDADTSVPVDVSHRFADALASVDVAVELVILPGVEHFYEVRALDEHPMVDVMPRIEEFLLRVLDVA